MEPVFLSLDEVLEIHEQQIERYGGSSGLRDSAGLESAVATPQATFGGEFLHPSIPAMAAAYLFHLCQNLMVSFGGVVQRQDRWPATSRPEAKITADLIRGQGDQHDFASGQGGSIPSSSTKFAREAVAVKAPV
jgi:hypothetical protein